MKIFFILLFLFFTRISHAQKNADNLFLELNMIENNVDKLNFLSKKISVHFNSDPETAYVYTKKYFSLANTFGTKRDIAEAYRKLAQVNNRLTKLDSAVDNYQKAIKLYQELGQKKSMAICLKSIGNILVEVGEYKMAYQYFYDSIEIFQQLDAKQNLINTYINLVRCFTYDRKYEHAIEYAIKVFDLSIQAEDLSYLDEFENSINMIEHYQRDYESARKYYLRDTEKIDENDSREWRLGVIYNNIGETYMNEGSLAKARDYFQQALEQKHKHKRPSSIAITLFNLGKLALKEKKNEEAIRLLKEAVSLMDISTYSNNLNEALELLIKIYKEKEHFTDQDHLDLLALNEMYHEQVKLLAVEMKKNRLNIVIKNAIAKEEAEYLEKKATGLQKRTVWIITGGLLIIIALIVFYARRETCIRRAITDMWKDLKDV